MLAEPMLGRPDSLPRGDYSFEVKWDGFRAIVCARRELGGGNGNGAASMFTLKRLVRR